MSSTGLWDGESICDSSSASIGEGSVGIDISITEKEGGFIALLSQCKISMSTRTFKEYLALEFDHTSRVFGGLNIGVYAFGEQISSLPWPQLDDERKSIHAQHTRLFIS